MGTVHTTQPVEMRLLLAVQRGDRAAVERAFEAGSRTAAASPLLAGLQAGANQQDEDTEIMPGCRAEVVKLPNQSAQHNGDRCLVVKREGNLYGVCCDSGVALRLKRANLKMTPGMQAALTTKDALWFACTLLPPSPKHR